MPQTHEDRFRSAKAHQPDHWSHPPGPSPENIPHEKLTRPKVWCMLGSGERPDS